MLVHWIYSYLNYIFLLLQILSTFLSYFNNMAPYSLWWYVIQNCTFSGFPCGDNNESCGKVSTPPANVIINKWDISCLYDDSAGFFVWWWFLCLLPKNHTVLSSLLCTNIHCSYILLNKKALRKRLLAQFFYY